MRLVTALYGLSDVEGCGLVWLNLTGTLSRCQHTYISILSLSLDFSSVAVVLLTRATFRIVLFCVICFLSLVFYAALLPRRGPHIASHSVRPSVCLSVRPVIDRYRASRRAT